MSGAVPSPHPSRERLRKVTLALTGIVTVLGIWQLAAYWVASQNEFGSDLLPTIQHVVTQSLPEMAQFGSETGEASYVAAFGVIAEHSAYTLARLLVGTGLGILIGVALGLAMTANRFLRAIVEPPVLVVRNIPLLALVPLFVLWFGAAETGKIVFVAYAITVMIVMNTVSAVANVRPIYIDYARTLGASRRKVYRTVILPAILPELLAGVKVALGVSWAVVLAAEFLAATAGLGKLLILSETFFDVGRMIVIVMVFMVYAVILNLLFDRLAARAGRWQERMA